MFEALKSAGEQVPDLTEALLGLGADATVQTLNEAFEQALDEVKLLCYQVADMHERADLVRVMDGILAARRVLRDVREVYQLHAQRPRGVGSRTGTQL